MGVSGGLIGFIREALGRVDMYGYPARVDEVAKILYDDFARGLRIADDRDERTINPRLFGRIGRDINLHGWCGVKIGSKYFRCY